MKMRNQHINEHHRAFVTYVRTKMFLKTRFRGIEGRQSVFISNTEIEKRFFPYPALNKKQELATLVKNGEIAITEVLRPDKSKFFLYEALKRGPIDLSMLIPIAEFEDDLIMKMKGSLTKVSLPFGAPSTPYFDLFLKHKDKYLNLFFRVDDFSGRVHTPVTSFKGDFRKNILIDRCCTCSIDVATMQPLLLGKILADNIGPNQFSDWINAGEDIYQVFQKMLKLNHRDEAKKRFFEVLFAPPNNYLVKIFGQSEWIEWINKYKTTFLKLNPHCKVKPHSNLAWLLQSTEVKLMRKVWQQLTKSGIPFLSVHDEVIIKYTDTEVAEIIMQEIFKKYFAFFKLSISPAGDCDIE